MREYAPEGWNGAEVQSFRNNLAVIGRRLSREDVLSLERAFDDGRFTDVVRELLALYYDPLYKRSCLEGRQFVWEFETSPDPIEDARRFVRGMAPVIEEVSSRGFPR